MALEQPVTFDAPVDDGDLIDYDQDITGGHYSIDVASETADVAELQNKVGSNPFAAASSEALDNTAGAGVGEIADVGAINGQVENVEYGVEEATAVSFEGASEASTFLDSPGLSRPSQEQPRETDIEGLEASLGEADNHADNDLGENVFNGVADDFQVGDADDEITYDEKDDPPHLHSELELQPTSINEMMGGSAAFDSAAVHINGDDLDADEINYEDSHEAIDHVQQSADNGMDFGSHELPGNDEGLDLLEVERLADSINAETTSPNGKADDEDNDALSNPEDARTVTTDDKRELPAITVSYRGDEYPLFSDSADGDDKLGFFTDLAVLDQSMDVVLEGLRDELANDLRNEEELCFQVDELGLEFTETTQRDFLTSVTLRQMLDIFQQLVKNQESATSRPLYTYLFTKLNPPKRLEHLIDSAYSGKSLDSLAHYYRSPMENDTERVDTENGGSAEKVEEEEVDGDSDMAGEEDQMNQAAQVNDYDDATSNGEDEEAINDGLHSTEDVQADNQHQQSVDDPQEEIMQDPFGEQTTNALDDHANVEDDETWNQHEITEAVADYPDQSHEASLNTEATFHTEQHNVMQMTGHTSATPTLNGDDVGNGENESGDVENAAQAELDTGLAIDDDGIGEIDWRDDNDVDLHNHGDALEDSVGGGKRSREQGEDDVLDLEDGQDFKRRRS